MNIRQFFKLFLLSSFVFLLIACSHWQPLLLNPSSTEPLQPSLVEPSGVQLESSESPSSPCRSVHHALGETCIPLNPERIATLTDVDLVSVLALGIRPIATVFYSNSRDVPAYLKDKLNQIQELGTEAQPSIERMLQIKPDLVLGLEHSVEPIYPLLSRIAPTVAGSWEGTSSWREHFNFVADVLDKTAAAQQVWAGYYQRVHALRSALGMDTTAPQQQRPLKVSVFHICCGSLHVDTKNSFNGSILADVGFERPKSQDVIVEGGVKFISEELISEIDADVLFIPTDSHDQDSNHQLTQLMQSPLWQQLEAVKQDNVFFVDYHAWRGANLFAADAVIDDLFEYLANSSIHSSR